MEYKLDEMFLEADKLINDQQITQALDLLHEIINEQPDYGRAHNHLGWLYENKLKKFNLAEHHYKAAINLTPEYPACWLNFAYFLGNLHRFTELEEHLQKCLKVPGISLSYIYNEFAIMYELKTNYNKAIEYYNKAILKSLNSKNIEEYEEAITRCKKKETIVGNNPTIAL